MIPCNWSLNISQQIQSCNIKKYIKLKVLNPFKNNSINLPYYHPMTTHTSYDTSHLVTLDVSTHSYRPAQSVPASWGSSAQRQTHTRRSVARTCACCVPGLAPCSQGQSAQQFLTDSALLYQLKIDFVFTNLLAFPLTTCIGIDHNVD